MNTSNSKLSNLRVETGNPRLYELEGWILECTDSFKPIIIGPDYKETWMKPDWSKNPVFSKNGITTSILDLASPKTTIIAPLSRQGMPF